VVFFVSNVVLKERQGMGKHVASVDTQVLERIRANAPEWIFTPADFTDLGSRTAVASALKRHKAAGTIRQYARGLYGVPRQHSLLGELLPGIDAVIAALERRDGMRFLPAGAYAANLLGLSEQVPARVIFLTDGPSRHIKVGPLEITLKHTTPRNMAAAGRLSGLLMQALRDLGPAHVTPARIKPLRKRLPADERQRLLKDLALAPAWMRPHFIALASDAMAGPASALSPANAAKKPSPRKARKASALA